MKISDINKISIKSYLAQINILPVKDRGYYGMYHSPFREDKSASMKVDYDKNLWIDFGCNEGGTLIDLVMRINNCSVGEAIAKLEKQYGNGQSDSFSFHGDNIVKSENNKSDEQAIVILAVKPLTHPSLFQYLNERCVNTGFAKQHCQEVHYKANDKSYFALGFRNDSGGYELRNKYFKGCTNKDVTTYTCIDNQSECCLVFEGFMDYLSYLTLKDFNASKIDAVILNSVTNLSKAMPFIRSHSKVYCFLDNDEAGRKTTLEIQKVCPTVIDQSAKYAKYKDLNDYLISVKQAQEKKLSKEIKQKPLRGLRR